jgi:hypothetical protein
MRSTGQAIFTASFIRVLAELSDAPGGILVHAVHDQTRGWQWVTERL